MKHKLLSMHKIVRYLPTLVLGMTCLFATSACYFGYAWWQAHTLNLAYRNKSILKLPLHSASPQQAYSQGYLLRHTEKNAKNINEASKAFTLAEVSNDEKIRARAKYALGNIYFDLALQSADIASGGAHQQAVAQIELAREAYKGALRLQPNLYEARFNLELLDRKSPEKRTQGWQAETDGVTLQPFKRNGTASMRDNTRRGLP